MTFEQQFRARIRVLIPLLDQDEELFEEFCLAMRTRFQWGLTPRLRELLGLDVHQVDQEEQDRLP